MSASTMLRAFGRLRAAGTVLQKRCVAATATQVDPIQQLFIDKVREYAQKRKVAGGGLVDVTPDVQKSLGEEIEKLNKQFGGSGEDFSKFPTFKFADAPLASPGVVFQAKEAETQRAAAAAAAAEEDEAVEIL